MAASSAPGYFDAYHTFADFIASDAELSIFRRFDRVNTRSLLYLQSEVTALEAQLGIYDEEDIKNGTMDVMLSAKCWETLSARAAEHPREAERLEVIRKIQNVTKQYNEALLLRSEILKLSPPEKRVFGAFNNWFNQAKPFVGLSGNLLRKRNDLVALKPSMEQDKLSRVLALFTGLFFAWKNKNQDSDHSTTYYSERVVNRVATVVWIIGASILLEAGIVTLYLTKNNHVRLGLIAVFTGLFAAALCVLSNARRAEMFAASAAYAAVLVVFLSGNFSSGNGSSNPPS